MKRWLFALAAFLIAGAVHAQPICMGPLYGPSVAFKTRPDVSADFVITKSGATVWGYCKDVLGKRPLLWSITCKTSACLAGPFATAVESIKRSTDVATAAKAAYLAVFPVPVGGRVCFKAIGGSAIIRANTEDITDHDYLAACQEAIPAVVTDWPDAQPAGPMMVTPNTLTPSGDRSVFPYLNGKRGGKVIAGVRASAAAACDCSVFSIDATGTYCAVAGRPLDEVATCSPKAP